jgi:hypothetical protein
LSWTARRLKSRLPGNGWPMLQPQTPTRRWVGQVSIRPCCALKQPKPKWSASPPTSMRPDVKFHLRARPTVCGNGHSLTPDNVQVGQDQGRWRCRQCGRARATACRARRQSQSLPRGVAPRLGIPVFFSNSVRLQPMSDFAFIRFVSRVSCKGESIQDSTGYSGSEPLRAARVG